jgi:dipeptidyl aminopeptidase/acylaminoacyl peptidase
VITRFSVLSYLIIICVIATFGQTKQTLTFEDVIGLNRASDVQISPDSRRVSFVLTSWDRENDTFNSDIWLAYDSREQAVKLTSHPKRDYHPRWSPDSRRLAFLSNRSSEKDSPAASQIFAINIYGGEPAQLTFHKSSIVSFAWSPDGRLIAFLAEEARSLPKTKPPVIVDQDYFPAQLWVLDVGTQQVKQLTRGSRHITDFNWSPDGSQIVFTARATPALIDINTTDVFITAADLKNAPYDTAGARQITQGNGAESEPRFSPDSSNVSYLARADGDPSTGPLRIHIAPLYGGITRALAQDFDGYISSYRWVYDSRRLIFLAGMGLHARIFTMTVDDQRPQVMTRNDGQSTGFSSTYDGMNIAFIHENPRMVNEIALLSARSLIPVVLTNLNPQIDQIALGQVESIKWRSDEQTEIEGLIFYPVGYETGQRYPLLTYIHGGPESAYVKGFNASWSAFPQIYAGRGIAVFMPNFRGSSNYGAEFAQSNTKLAGKVDYEDVMSGISQLVKIGLADENRLALAGWSYGGYLSAWIIGHSNRFKCAAYGAGLSNAVSYWGTADIVHQRERLHGGVPWEARKSFDEQSPLSYLTNVKTPVLIFHGEKDERVPLGQSQETYRTLKRLGVKTQLVIYPDQGHTLTVPSYQLDKMKREFAWIEKYLIER